jgi:hypothetical protein
MIVVNKLSNHKNSFHRVFYEKCSFKHLKSLNNTKSKDAIRENIFQTLFWSFFQPFSFLVQKASSTLQ